MSQAESTQSSSVSESNHTTVGVIPTGIAGSPRYIDDMTAVAEAVVSEVGSLAGSIGTSVDEVVIRGSYEIAEAVDEAFGDDGPEVDSYSIDFRTMLDDEGNEDYDIPSVIEDGDPVASVMAQVNEDMTSEEIMEFDLNDRDDRDDIGYEVLDAMEDTRVNRAKAKAKGKATERLLTDWFDSVPTIDHVVILEDNTSNHETASSEVRGINDWVKVPSSVDGSIRPVQLSAGADGPLNWTLAMLESGDLEVDELSDSQEATLRETLDEDELADLGLGDGAEAEADANDGSPRPDAEAAAAAGSPADD